MGETIDFPLNNRMFFQKAVDSLENFDFETALKYIEKIYETDQSAWINYVYTTVLHNLDRNEEALEVANEQKDAHLKHERYRLLYATLLIKNQLFLEAEVIIQNSLNSQETVHIEEWENIEDELTNEQEAIKQEVITEKIETKNKLINLGEYSRSEQHEVIDHAHELDLKDLQEVAQQIFINPYTSVLTKRAFLEILVEKGDSHSYRFSWFDRQLEVVPDDLLVFEEHTVLKTLDERLEKKCYKLPDIINTVKMEVINDLLLLYPFIDEVVVDIDYWLNYYIKQFDANNILNIDTTPKTAAQIESKQYIEKLNLMAQRPSDL